MMASFLPRPATLLAAAAISVSGSAYSPAHAAGLLDFLFGGSSPPPQQQVAPGYYHEGRPLEMRVNPRRRAEPARIARPRPEKRDTKVRLATPIDPKKNPDWFLEDSTLRKGDIVVLKGKVLVFEGNRSRGAMADFASLGESRLVSKGERVRIEGMAGLPATPAPVASAPKVTEATEAAKTFAASAGDERVKQVSLSASE